MGSGANDIPSRVQERCGIDTSFLEPIDDVANQRHEFGDVDRGRRMDTEADAHSFATIANPSRPRGVDPRNDVVATVQLDIDGSHVVLEGPLDSFLQGGVSPRSIPIRPASKMSVSQAAAGQS